MKNTHVLIPLSVYDTLKSKLASITGEGVEALMDKALITGKMSMLYDPEFTRLKLDPDSEELLKNNNQTLKLSYENN